MNHLHLRALDPFLRGKRLSDINMDLLWSIIQSRRERDRVANSTINRALEVVRRILNLAHRDWNRLPRVPRVRMLKEPKRRVRFLTREEADRLNEALPAHLRPVVQFALATGCRMSEFLQLKWSRVDFDRRVDWLDPDTTKNGEGRGIPLNTVRFAAHVGELARDEWHESARAHGVRSLEVFRDGTFAMRTWRPITSRKPPVESNGLGRS